MLALVLVDLASTLSLVLVVKGTSEVLDVVAFAARMTMDECES